MKVILSRKGFDSAYGGFPSPILPDGKIISLPIPSEDSLVKYSDLKIDEQRTFLDLILQLNNWKARLRFGRRWLELNQNTRCHLDPDIYQNITKRPKDWKPYSFLQGS